jgi:hypothetical protein
VCVCVCVYIYIYIHTHTLLTQYCSGDKIEKNEMSRACSIFAGEEWRIQGFGGET